MCRTGRQRKRLARLRNEGGEGEGKGDGDWNGTERMVMARNTI
jgi:hypothetical protein